MICRLLRKDNIKYIIDRGSKNTQEALRAGTDLRYLPLFDGLLMTVTVIFWFPVRKFSS